MTSIVPLRFVDHLVSNPILRGVIDEFVDWVFDVMSRHKNERTIETKNHQDIPLRRRC